MKTTCLAEVLGRCGEVGVFIDGANLARMPNRLGGKQNSARSLDFVKFHRFLGSFGTIRFIHYYTAIRYTERVEKFLNLLEELSFKVIHRSTKTYQDGSEKGNLDTIIVLDMLRLADCYQTAILVSGDSDYAPTVEHLLKSGKRVVVISSLHGLSRELEESGANMVYLDDFDGRLTYVRQPRRQRHRR